MAKRGDRYCIELKRTHLEWGTFRYTGSRNQIYGEGYIPIPKQAAKDFGILNSNATGGLDIIGENVFYCTSEDGLFKGELKAQGCSVAGDRYAKQFSANDNLKAIGSWYCSVNAVAGDIIEVEWISDKEIIIRKL